MCDIKETKIEKVIECLKDDYFGKSCLLNIINLFSHVKNINEQDLANYIGTDLDEVEGGVKELWHEFPDRINCIIKKVQAVCF